jgi:hypothetical protein
MSQHANPLTLTFRCPAELEGRIPLPQPAAQGLPDWFKAMPPQAFNAVNSGMGDTVKRCPPFIDAMTSGFLLPLICDVKVENGEFTWDNDLPPGGKSASCVRRSGSTMRTRSSARRCSMPTGS